MRRGGEVCGAGAVVGASRLDREEVDTGIAGRHPGGPGARLAHPAPDSPTLGAVAIDGEVLVGDETLGALKRLDCAEERGGYSLWE